ncbi:Protein ECT2 [Nymphon striatum]|nr:Protein ECT2 [Nymphon striatum]
MEYIELCVIGQKLKENVELMEAVKKFNIPINFYDDWKSVDKPQQAIFILDAFETEMYDKLHNEHCKILGPTAVLQLSEIGEAITQERRPLYTRSMCGVTLCFTGFRKTEVVARYVNLVHHMGGSIKKEFKKEVTHVIAKTVRGDKYRYAANMGLPILSEEWIDNAWSNCQDPNFSIACDMEKYKIPPFFSCQIAFVGFQPDDEKHMKEMAVKYGAVVVESPSSECTHVVVDSDAPAPTDVEGKKIFILKSDWFWASIRVDSCAEESIYLHSPANKDTRLASVLSPHNHLGQSKRISRGYKRKRELKETVAQLAREGGQLDVSRHLSDLFNNQSCSSIGSFLDASNLLSPDVRETSPVAAPEVKPVTKRHQICKELIQTESNYVQILNTILQIKAELEEPDNAGNLLLEPTEVKIIFGNVPPIHESKNLVKAYPPFVNFFEKTKDSLNHCDSTKPRFHAFLKLWQSKKECGRQSLRELFIRPVQRLPSVILLLNDLLKNTNKNNPDYTSLESAINSIKDVVSLINECKRKTEGQLAMFNLFNEVENCPPNLVSSHRSLIMQADLLILNENLGKKGQHLTLFLFSDILEICKKRQKFSTNSALRSPSTVSLQAAATSKKCYKHLEMMPLSYIKRVVNINETEGGVLNVKNVFALICRSNEELKERLYTFAFVDRETNKLQFLRLLCRHIANTVCRNDADNFLTTQDPQNLNINTSDISTRTIARMLGGMAKSKDKLVRALSLKRNNTLTPQMMKQSTSAFSGRRFSRAVSSIISPMRAAVTPSGIATLPRKFQMSTTNLQVFMIDDKMMFFEMRMYHNSIESLTVPLKIVGLAWGPKELPNNSRMFEFPFLVASKHQ